MRRLTHLVVICATAVLLAACRTTDEPAQATAPSSTNELVVKPPANTIHAPVTIRSTRGILGAVERYDGTVNALLAGDAQIEKLAEGFDWSEGPVWMPGGYLLFSDVPMNTIFKWTEQKGVTIYIQPSGYTSPKPRGGEPGSNGLARDKQGRLVIAQHGDRRVTRMEKDGTGNIVGEYHHLRRLNSPNDVVVKSNGDIYFTDPPYGLVGNMADPTKELPFQGVYRISARDGAITLLTREMSRPNGLAFSPDEKTLYVANSDPDQAVWMAFPVNADGTLGGGSVLLDVTSYAKGRKGMPDGLKTDRDGNLWATGPGGVLIITPSGKHIGTLATGEATANCAWGENGSVLYITADMYLCRISTLTKGAGW
jgi:gluconolactonase